ncbi:hypothetical protein K4K49_010777 [Colletotrichum sp. SAR 10_70]|nr:hypothetical protein K4K50_010953 [Colletotrichum sp. SAR 10_71]KAI8152263.1 hypothetical protein K4K49_010777 [Colletotrichum sp. SAR 10_70]KAI8153514.1 hypothetical protein KHU50_011071 [Colletotrichum sp. SAR 10_65]KAI8218573.1 hypothetical protein K4K54_010255 [Colletotrichum sp. SAR 10_86]
MEQFQLLDEHVSNLILRFGFLDVEDLPFATAEEVENAAALALQMAAPEELIEIAPEDPNPGVYIDWQERNRILADSPVEPDDGAEEGGEDCIICSGGRVSAAINGVSSAEGTGGAGAHRAVLSMEDVNVVFLCVNACFDTSKDGGRWITTHAIDHREGSLTLSHRQQSLQICLSFSDKSSRSNRHYLQNYKPALCHDQCLKVGDPNWRRDSPENMRRIREGDETEGRVWPHHEKIRRVSTAGSGTADSSGTAGAVA